MTERDTRAEEEDPEERHAVRSIVAKEGVGGLYRGFGASIVTLVPGSALWWGFYGTYQRLIWSVVPASLGGGGGAEWIATEGVGGVGVREGESGDAAAAAAAATTTTTMTLDSGGGGGGGGSTGVAAVEVEPSDGTVMGVQIASGVCAGATSGFMTTPLDIVKTRLQVLSGAPG